MEDPVIGSDGITYERAAIEAWINSGHRTSPVTREPMYRQSLIPNYALKALIQESGSLVSVPTPTPVCVKPPPIQLTAEMITGTDKLHIHLTVPKTSDDATMPTFFIDVLDNSGSMDSSSVDCPASDAANFNRSDLVRHSVATQIELLRPQDKLAIVLFDHNAETILNPTAMTQQGRAEAKRCLPKIRPTGGTSIWSGLQKALALASQPEHANEHIVIILQTDGESDASLNPPRGIPDTFRSWRDAHPTVKLTLHTVGYGFGSALDMPLLRNLAEIGHGTVNYIPDGSMVGTVFIHLMANLMTCLYRGVKIHIPTKGKSMTCKYRGAMMTIPLPSDDRIIPVGYLQAGQTRDFVLTVPSCADIDTIRVTTDNTPEVASTMLNSCILQSHCVWPVVHEQLVENLQRALNAAEASRLGEAQAAIQELTELCQQHASDPNVRAVLTDLADPDTYKGQIGKAFATIDAFNRWGRHYVPGVLSGHKQQWPINFRDEGSKFYGIPSGLTRRMIDRGDEIFNSLPPPTASCVSRSVGSGYTPIASMASVHSPVGGCFLGSSRVRMLGGYERRCDEIQPGDRDIAGYVIAKVIKMHVPYADVVRLSGHLRIAGSPPTEGGFTPWHPVFPSSSDKYPHPTQLGWVHPADLGPVERVDTDAVYNFVLEYDTRTDNRKRSPGDNRPGILIVDGIMACTLGHDMTGPVITHSFFGKKQGGIRNIIDDLKLFKGWDTGYLDIKHYKFLHDSKTGNICGLIAE
jgi:hypothetical protein